MPSHAAVAQDTPCQASRPGRLQFMQKKKKKKCRQVATLTSIFTPLRLHWAIPFNKGTPPMDDRAICLDTPRTDSSLQRITEILLKFTRECGDIPACQYPLGQILKNHPWGVPLLNGIAYARF